MKQSWKKSKKLALGIAMALGCSMSAVAFADQTINDPITGPKELSYAENVTIDVENNMIAGGPWLPNIGAAVSASGDGTELSIDMGGNALTINGTSSSHSTGIAAINKGIVTIENPGAMSITATSTGTGQTAALFVNGGGQIFVNNDDASVLKLTGSTGVTTNGAVVKAMNGVKDTRSYIKINGLVDITADATDSGGMGEGVSAVASTIEIGGGKIMATKNGVNPDLNYGFAENCAIRAYGEFVSTNYGIVNVNVTKASEAADAKATGAGDKTVQILGNFSTVGGMGTKGTINIGLNTADSYWNGNYDKGAGWGETPGEYGSVNLFMGNGAKWIGNAEYATAVKMSGAGTLWNGYSLNNAVQAEITNGAEWHNFNENNTTTLQSLRGGSSAANAGLVYMTTFEKLVNGLNGKATAFNTGDVSIANYAGNIKVFYNHDASDVTSILGGNFTIANAETGSAINLITNSVGIDMSDATEVNTVLDNLAKKLYYTGYVNNERNLDGTVTIAEGLTTASATKQTGKIAYDSATGQGSLNANTTSAAKMKVLQAFAEYDAQDTTPADDTEGLVFNTPLNGMGAYWDEAYIAAGVVDDNGVFNFKKDATIYLNPKTSYGVGAQYGIGNAVAGIFVVDDNEFLNTVVDMNGNTLNLHYEKEGNESLLGSSLVGINVSKGSTLNINNAGAINVTIDSASGQNYIIGAVAAGGSKLFIHNGGDNLEDKIFSFRSFPYQAIRAIQAETKLSKNGEESQLVIDGLVNVVAEDQGNSMNYAVYADSAQVDIGGGRFIGRLQTQHGYNYGDVTQININTEKDVDGNIIGSGDNVVQIEGEVKTKHSSKKLANRINIGLNGSESYLKGDVIGVSTTYIAADNESSYDSMTNYGVNLFMDNGADWTGNAKGALTLRMHNGATWHGGSYGSGQDIVQNMSMTLDTGSVWYQSGTEDITVDYFTGGKDEASQGTIVMEGDKDVTLSNYAGNTIVSFQRDDEYPTRVLGGNLTIGSAAEGSVITMSTDNNGIDTSNVEELTKVFDKLAGKLTYTGAIDGAENNLDGYVQIAEGLTASSAALKMGDIEFSAEDGKGSLKEGSIITPDGKKNPSIIYGSKETAMMKGAKTAMASSALMWRAENNDIMKRMGDLRLADDESGIWAKYYGGKYSMDAQNTDLTLKYNAFQVGYDKEVGGNWKAGVAVSYNDGNSTYGTGRADLKNTSLGLYGTWLGDDGQYLDLIAKYSRIENEFDVKNVWGNKLNGDYKTWGASLSAEYGKRFEGKNGMYVDPSVELTVGRMAAKDYTATSDYLGSLGKNRNMSVEQDAFTSCIGRIGVSLGQKTDNASYYVKLAAAHEFSGDFDTTYKAEGEQGGKTSISFGDTWYEAQVGMTAKLSAANTFYASYGCSFGGDVEQKYRLDAGLRWSF